MRATCRACSKAISPVCRSRVTLSSATSCSRSCSSACTPGASAPRPRRSRSWRSPRNRSEAVMKFAALIEYIPDKARIAELRPTHRQYLASLKEQGKLAVSGPFTDDWGALIVYEAATREEAETLLRG